jgi:hypothetical protein
VWEGQEAHYQQLSQDLGDRHLQLDGSYSQRRQAEHCFVTLLTQEHHLVVLSAVGSKKELGLSSQALELDLSTKAVVKLATSALKPISITHDEHTGVTKMLADHKHLLPACVEYHDSWHRRRLLAKYLPSSLEQTKIPQNMVEDISRKVLMIISSAHFTYAGNTAAFLSALEKVPDAFVGEGPKVVEAIRQFLKGAYPQETARLYISNTDTSTLEGFHGHHHQLVGKARYLILYRARSYLFNLIWNANRLDDLLLKKDGVRLPPGLMQGDDWLRNSQKGLGLLEFPKEPPGFAEKNRNHIREKKRLKEEKKLQKRKKHMYSSIEELLNEESNSWF